MIDIVIVNSLRPTQSSTEIAVQTIYSPERTSPTLHLNMIDSANLRSLFAMQAYCKSQPGGCTEQTPSMIDAGLGSKIVTLQKTRHDTSQACLSTLFGQLLLRCCVKHNTVKDIISLNTFPTGKSENSPPCSIILILVSAGQSSLCKHHEHNCLLLPISRLEKTLHLIPIQLIAPNFHSGSM